MGNFFEFPLGLKLNNDFVFSDRDQELFATLSGDKNPVHLDRNFATEQGYPAPIVYGALLIAKVSEIIGMRLPGPIGIWSGLQIDFRQPLYVHETANLEMELVQLSEATRSMVMKFNITSGEKLVATGRAMATLR